MRFTDGLARCALAALLLAGVSAYARGVHATPTATTAKPKPKPKSAKAAPKAADAPAASAPKAPTAAPKAPAAAPKAPLDDDEGRTVRRADLPKQWYEAEVPAPKLRDVPFRPGEHILFRITVLGKDAGWGEARTLKKTRRGGRSVVPIESLIRSKGFFDQVFPVHDQTKSWVDLTSATTVHAEMNLNENRHQREITLDFGGRTAGRVKGRYAQGKQVERIDERAPLRGLDPLAAFYHLRAREIAVGDRFPLFVHNGRRFYRMDVHVVKQEEVYTDLGMKPAWRIEARATRADGSRPGWHQDMRFWLSTDSLRLPLRMTFELSIGSVEAHLAGVKGIRGREDLEPKADPARPAAAEAAPAPAAAPAR
jgi:hypothetical protein